ncbi:MAG: hypothetical protein JXB32_16425 [Deltaproteobacteria bacterium]|nr:hypothetical protein [Deltaproteobacteria bacterium]
MQDGGTGKLLACLGAACGVHLALLPLLGFLLGHGERGGDRWNPGITAWLEVAPSPADGAKAPAPEPPRPRRAVEHDGAKSATTPVARAEAARRSRPSVPPGAVAPRDGRRRGVDRRSIEAPAPSFSAAPATGPDPGPPTFAPSAAGTVGSPAGAGEPHESSAPALLETPTPELPASQAGCVETAEGLLCGHREDGVLNRPRELLGGQLGYGYQEQVYDFHREGRDWVYRPDSHNAIIVREDGSIAEESGPKPSDALCILGGAPLPWDIPTIPHYQYREAEEATAGLRHRLADERDAENTRAALGGLREELATAVGRGGRTPAEQRRFLFLRWDECLESGAGLDARATIERFIRDRYPEGSPAAYTPAELEALNAGRRSTAPFQPYGGR